MDLHSELPHPRPAEAAKAKVGPLAIVAALVVVVVAVGIVLATRGDGIETDSGSASSADAAATDSPGTPDGPATSTDAVPMPAFTADLRGGGTLDSADIEGPAMIQVFASWCPTCQAHAPDVATVQGEFDGKLGAYYINVADDGGPAQQFIDRYKWMDGPVLIDDNRDIAGEFDLIGQPHTIFVNADGAVTDIFKGGGSVDDLRMAAERVTGT